MNKLLPLAACAFFVATGCATAQTPVNAAPARPQLSPEDQALRNEISACDLTTRPELQALVGKFPLSIYQIHQPSLAMLSTDRVPNGTEQDALVVYDQLHRGCVQAEIEWCNTATYGAMPTVCAAQSTMLSKEQASLAALYQGKVTFAQFTKTVNALHINLQNAMMQMAQRAYNETQERMPRSAPRQPVTTNCYNYGTQVSCTTQ
jgi:hypothetical protein